MHWIQIIISNMSHSHLKVNPEEAIACSVISPCTSPCLLLNLMQKALDECPAIFAMCFCILLFCCRIDLYGELQGPYSGCIFCTESSHHYLFL